MFKAILKSDAETVLSAYRKRREMSGNGNGEKPLPRSLQHQSPKTKVQSPKTLNQTKTSHSPKTLQHQSPKTKAQRPRFLKKSLELNPDNTNAVQKLKELGG